MKIDFSTDTPTIDAADLARALEMTPDEVAELMRAGAIVTQFETGVGEDAGLFRLRFRHGGLSVRFTCNAKGDVLKTTRVRVKERQ
ncbi:DUF6522 family protein [Roseovarius sp. S4756]|uniref:DUF6522 family protein n=1 Tax=Roseovarius maritimus TaxID=3342637 RepID=UPI0037267213